MSNESMDEVLRYAQVNSLMLNTYGEECLDISYEDMIKDLKETAWSSSAAEGGYIYKLSFHALASPCTQL